MKFIKNLILNQKPALKFQFESIGKNMWLVFSDFLLKLNKKKDAKLNDPLLVLKTYWKHFENILQYSKRL